MLDRTPQLARQLLLRAEDGPLAWQAGIGWRPRPASTPASRWRPARGCYRPYSSCMTTSAPSSSATGGAVSCHAFSALVQLVAAAIKPLAAVRQPTPRHFS